MRVAKKHVGRPIVPISHAEIAQGFDDEGEDDVYLIGNVGLGLSAKDGIDEGGAIAYRDHLRQRGNSVGGSGFSQAGLKIQVAAKAGIVWWRTLPDRAKGIVAVMGCNWISRQLEYIDKLR